MERIGDHAMNICEYTNLIESQGISFSNEVKEEIDEMRDICGKALDFLGQIKDNTMENVKAIEDFEQKIDDMTEDYRKKQLVRMQKGTCSEAVSYTHLELIKKVL